MLKNKKNIAVITLVLIFSMLFLVACGGQPPQGTDSKGEDKSPVDKNEDKDPDKDKDQDQAGTLPIVDEKITLSILAPDWAGIKVGNDMPVIQELEKRTNIHLEFELLPLTDTAEKFSVIMASKQLPDIISYGNHDEINRYGMEGAFLPLQDLIDEHAPNLKKSLDNPLEGQQLPYDMDPWAEITSDDGNIYAIPLLSASNALGPLWGIRVDWLDSLDLKMPETLDELYEALKAFKEKDPNGNNEADEIPFVAGQGAGLGRVLPLINAFGAHIDLYVDEDSNTIKYGPVESEYKEGLEFLNKLYSEGILEEDYLTSDLEQWKAKATGDKAGFMMMWPGSGFAAANAGLKELNPDFRIMPIAPVKGPKGHQFKDTFTAGRTVVYRTTLSHSNKYPEETIKLMDYLFTDEGLMLSSYGLEGTHYNLEGGEPVYTDIITDNPEGLDPEVARIKDGLIWTTLPYEMGWEPHFQAMEANAPWTVQGWELYRESGMVEAPMPTLKFTQDELSKKNQIVADINTYKDAVISKFIMGEESFDKFDDFVSQIEKAGLEELLKIYNDAYTRYKENAGN